MGKKVLQTLLVYDDLRVITNQILTPFFTAFVATNISTNIHRGNLHARAKFLNKERDQMVIS